MRPTLIPIALALAAIPLTALAQNADPFSGKAKPGTKPAPAKTDVELSEPYNIEVCYETFSLPLVQAAALRRLALPDSDLYGRIVKMVSEKEAKQECFTLIRVPAGHKATTESISETIYPTEYEPPELPNTVGVQIVGPKSTDAPSQIPEVEKLDNAPALHDFSGVQTPATPTAFETRNIGHTFEIEPNSSGNAGIIELRLAPEHVSFVGESVHGQGLSEVHMPEFESQRISAAAKVKSGVPHLLGTISRPPSSKIDPDSANTTWFAFVTARPVIPE